MSLVNYVEAGEKKIPFKFTKRTLVNFKSATGQDLAAGDTVALENIGTLCHEAIKTGHLVIGKKCDLTINDVWDLDDTYDLFDKMMVQFDADEKKPEAS